MISMTNTMPGAAIVERARAFAARHRPPVAPEPAPARLCTVEDAVRRMADDMMDVAGIAGCAQEEDLLRRGWSLTALRKFGAAARDRANRASRRRA